MFAVLIVVAAYLYFVDQVIFHGFRIHNFITSIAIAAVGFFVIVFWSLHRLSTPKQNPRRQAPIRQTTAAPARQAAATPDPCDTVKAISFKVAGVTYDNDDGSSRQEILKHLFFHDAPYADAGEEYDTEIVESFFDGEPALEVHINGYQVGFVPKSQIRAVQRAMSAVASWSITETKIYGGRTKDGEQHSWGCAITGTYIED